MPSVVPAGCRRPMGNEIVTFTADLGPDEELRPARQKAEMMGAKEIFVDDLAPSSSATLFFQMFRANALYEGATICSAPPVGAAADRQTTDRDRAGGRRRHAVAHGATGRVNDQVQIRTGRLLRVGAARHQGRSRRGAGQDLTSRTRLIEYADQRQIPIAPATKRGEAPFSVDANLFISAEGKVLGGPVGRAREYVFSHTVGSGTGARPAAICRKSISPRRSGGGRWRGAVAGRGADAPQ